MDGALKTSQKMLWKKSNKLKMSSVFSEVQSENDCDHISRQSKKSKLMPLVSTRTEHFVVW